jgi:hypothetical protein
MVYPIRGTRLLLYRTTSTCNWRTKHRKGPASVHSNSVRLCGKAVWIGRNSPHRAQLPAASSAIVLALSYLMLQQLQTADSMTQETTANAHTTQQACALYVICTAVVYH